MRLLFSPRGFLFMPRKFYLQFIILFLLLPVLSACSVLQKKENKESVNVKDVKPLKPEESKALIKDVAGNWFYGHGLGNSMLQVGTIVAFPPYAVVAVGNAVLNLSGYESIGVSTVLPEKSKKKWNSMYDYVTSGPGRMTSAMAGKEFVTRDIAGAKIARYIHTSKPTDIPSNEQWAVE